MGKGAQDPANRNGFRHGAEMSPVARQPFSGGSRVARSPLATDGGCGAGLPDWGTRGDLGMEPWEDEDLSGIQGHILQGT